MCRNEFVTLNWHYVDRRKHNIIVRAREKYDERIIVWNIFALFRGEGGCVFFFRFGYFFLGELRLRVHRRNR